MSHEYYWNCVEFYLSHVLTKFLIVGRDLWCTKKLNTRAMSTILIGLCEINFRAMSAIWIVLKLQTTNQSRVYYLEHLFYSALKSKWGDYLNLCTLVATHPSHLLMLQISATCCCHSKTKHNFVALLVRFTFHAAMDKRFQILVLQTILMACIESRS